MISCISFRGDPVVLDPTITQEAALARIAEVQTALRILEQERELLETFLGIPSRARERKDLTGKASLRAEAILRYLGPLESATTHEITQHLHQHEPGVSPTSLRCYVSSLLNYLSRQKILLRVTSGRFRIPTDVPVSHYPPDIRAHAIELRDMFRCIPTTVLAFKDVSRWVGERVPGDPRHMSSRLLTTLLKTGDIVRTGHGKYRSRPSDAAKEETG